MSQPLRNITGFQLKIAAIIAMTCNHTANVFGSQMPGWLDFILYSVGGMTFPIMAFLLVEGFIHTSSLRDYALRLFFFALLAQIPYSILWGVLANVLFTLLLGLGMLWLCKRYGDGAGLVSAVLASIFLGPWFDWGSIGFVVIILFYLLRDKRQTGISVTMGLLLVVILVSALVPLSLNDIGYALIGFPIATVLLCGYRGERGRPMKWFFYAYYPLHLFALWALSIVLQ